MPVPSLGPLSCREGEAEENAIYFLSLPVAVRKKFKLQIWIKSRQAFPTFLLYSTVRSEYSSDVIRHTSVCWCRRLSLEWEFCAAKTDLAMTASLLAIRLKGGPGHRCKGSSVGALYSTTPLSLEVSFRVNVCAMNWDQLDLLWQRLPLCKAFLILTSWNSFWCLNGKSIKRLPSQDTLPKCSINYLTVKTDEWSVQQVTDSTEALLLQHTWTLSLQREKSSSNGGPCTFDVELVDYEISMDYHDGHKGHCQWAEFLSSQSYTVHTSPSLVDAFHLMGRGAVYK